MSSEEERYERAKKRVKEIREFYNHLAAYVVVIGGLTVLNLLTTSFPWVLFVVFGWGIGLAMHWMNCFGFSVIFGEDWEERKIRQLMGEKPKHQRDEESYFEEKS
jgi:hypothetical protein